MKNINRKSQYFLSIIVPIYNVRSYLIRCLESICITNECIQIILVDDGSTDKSNIIAKQFAQEHYNIVYIHQINKGASAARNTGLNYATGQWVYFVDADDYVDKQFINNLLNKLKIENGFFLFSLPIVSEHAHQMTKLQDYDDELSVDHYIVKLIHGKRQFGVWSYVFNLHIIKSHNLYFTENNLYEDQYFLPNYLSYIRKIKEFSGDELGFYHYQFRPESFTHQQLSYSQIASKYNAEMYRDFKLLSLSKDEFTIHKIRENKITVAFRAYIDFLKIGMIDEAKNKRQVILNMEKQIEGKKEIKTKIKIIISLLPVKVSLFFLHFFIR